MSWAGGGAGEEVWEPESVVLRLERNKKNHLQERLKTLQAVPGGCQKQPLPVRNYTAHEGRNRKPRDTKEDEEPNWVKSNVLAGCPWVGDGTVLPCHWTVDGMLWWWCEKCAEMEPFYHAIGLWMECCGGDDQMEEVNWVPLLPIWETSSLLHCINSKSYIAQKSVSIHSGPDSIVMHSFFAHLSLLPILWNNDEYFFSQRH